MTLLIRNGRVIDPASNVDMTADVLVENGIVSKVMPQIQDQADQQINAEGCYVMPDRKSVV